MTTHRLRTFTAADCMGPAAPQPRALSADRDTFVREALHSLVGRRTGFKGPTIGVPGCTGSPAARSTYDNLLNRHLVRTRCAVVGATPVSAASCTGPIRLRSRNATIRFVRGGHVLAGIACGREDRSFIGCPAAYRLAHRFTVGHEHWNRAATSGRPCR